VADIPDITIPELMLVDSPGEAPVKATLHRMVDVLKSGKKPPERPVADVTGAFDRGFKGAELNLGDEDPQLWRKNPVTVGTKRGPYKPKGAGGSGRPAGAEDLQGLFATGIILILAFAVGEWATPTADEATAIAHPLSNILARRIDLAAKLGKDASDTIALAVACLSYLARVGPIAAERVRENVDKRRRRERVVREPSNGPTDGGGEGSVDAWEADRQGPDGGQTYRPFDALAKAQRNGLGVLDRDLGGAQGRTPPVGY
jgi:hypothetical protein